MFRRMQIPRPLFFCSLPCAFLLSLLVSGSPAEEGADWYREQRLLFGGMPVQVCFAPRDDALAAKAWASLDDYEAISNDWRDDSEIGRINAGGLGTYRLSPGLMELFDLADGMRGTTGGAFDITVGPLRHLWRGAATSGVWPDEAQLAAVRAAIGPATYRRQADRLQVLAPGVKFDFGGIKGHAIDRITIMLREAGCRVDYETADVADPQAADALCRRIRARHGRIDGVLHCAGVAGRR